MTGKYFGNKYKKNTDFYCSHMLTIKISKSVKNNINVRLQDYNELNLFFLR